MGQCWQAAGCSSASVRRRVVEVVGRERRILHQRRSGRARPSCGLLLNAGDGTFPTSIALPRGSAITGSIAAADVDGDLDVLLANGGSPLFARGSRRPTYEAVACASWLVREHRLDAGLAARVARLVVAARVDRTATAIDGRACVSSE